MDEDDWFTEDRQGVGSDVDVELELAGPEANGAQPGTRGVVVPSILALLISPVVHVLLYVGVAGPASVLLGGSSGPLGVFGLLLFLALWIGTELACAGLLIRWGARSTGRGNQRLGTLLTVLGGSLALWLLVSGVCLMAINL